MAKVRCFTLRLPPELYAEVHELSVVRDKTMNATVIDLIKVAMQRQVDIGVAVKQLLSRELGIDVLTTES